MVLDKDIIPVKPEKVDELVKLWELSVRATHFFLSESDIVALRPLVKEGIKQLENVYCICDEWDKAVAFMGIEGNKLEMLFVHPQCRARGVGKKMINQALSLGVRYVDVNEQNPQAVGFYEHLGFRCFRRSELDGQGNPFPILHLKLKK
ncbi:GNAT family N-acetyltransferase [uncultured Culturomica sp.]|jgi:putative acetyltransferase|uniref:GNAT family N-acetyltransferase n=1 Tax=uncultured Culturomica sp. TaxID=1926654 RepID=UPI00033C25F0|nr:GNAT family N-acetyltransferase [uncultured Culturomica sp.]CCZ10606.1 putative uncharacterized protein [Odoribacter sp. CAG:788]